MIRALVIARDSSHQGGIVSFIELLVANFSQDIQAYRFVIGRSPDKQSRGGSIITTIYDSVRLIREVRKHRPDVIHINPSLNFNAMLRDGFLMMALATMIAPPVVVFIHGWDQAFSAKVRKSRLARHFLRSLLNRAGGIVVLANRFKEELCALGTDGRKIYVTTTMFDRNLFEAVQRKHRAPGPHLLFLSRLVKEKGIHELLAAFLILKSRLPGLRLTIAGDGPEYQRVDRWINDQHLNHQVVLTGYLRGQAKAQALLDADIFVFPSYYGDGCPVSLLEAMAARLGVVTTAVGGIPDFFVDGENGSLLDSASPASIADAVFRLLEDQNRLEIIRDNNRLAAWGKYEASMITRKIEEIYEYAISGSKTEIPTAD